MRNLLNAHPEIAIPLESLFIVDYLRAEGRVGIETLKRMLVKEPEVEEWGLKIRYGDIADCSSVAMAIERLHELYARRHGKQRWGQKTPRLVRSVDLIADAFPGALFIHLMRDPRAVVNSLIRSDVHRSDPYHASLRWRMDVGAGLDFARQYPEKVLTLKYEDLVRDPTRALEEVARYLGISFESELLRGGSGRKEFSKFYENIHRNLDGPLTTARIDSWKRELHPKSIAVIEAINRDLMQTVGYEPIQEAHEIAASYVLKTRVWRLARMILQVGRYLKYRRNYIAFLVYRKWRIGLFGDFIRDLNY